MTTRSRTRSLLILIAACFASAFVLGGCNKGDEKGSGGYYTGPMKPKGTQPTGGG